MQCARAHGVAYPAGARLWHTHVCLTDPAHQKSSMAPHRATDSLQLRDRHFQMAGRMLASHVEMSSALRALSCAARAHLHAAHSRKAAGQPQEEKGAAPDSASKGTDGRRTQQDRQRGPRADYLADVGGPKMRAPQSGTGFRRRYAWVLATGPCASLAAESTSSRQPCWVMSLWSLSSGRASLSSQALSGGAWSVCQGMQQLAQRAAGLQHPPKGSDERSHAAHSLVHTSLLHGWGRQQAPTSVKGSGTPGA